MSRFTTFLDRHFPKNAAEEDKDKKSSSGKLIVNTDLIRKTFSIGDWRDSVEVCEDVDFPDRIEQARLYKDLKDDDAIKQGMSVRTAKAVKGSMSIQDSEGEELDNVKDIFFKPSGYPRRWFKQWMELQVSSKFYGAVLIQYGIIENGRFKDVTAVDYKNIIPEKDLIIVNTDLGWTYGGDNVINFKKGIVSKWCQLAYDKDPRNLGLLNCCAPYYIWKNDSLGNWSMFQEMFGVDTKVGKTDTTDLKRRQAMDAALANSVGAAYMTINTEDEVDFISSKVSDSFNTFKEPIGYYDKAIAKLLMCQTSLAEEKSFVGSAEIQLEAFEDCILFDKMDISDNFEEDLIPFMQMHGMIPDGDYFLVYDMQEQVSMLDMSNIVDKLAKYYNINEEEISKRFGITLEKKELDKNDDINNTMTKIHNALT